MICGVSSVEDKRFLQFFKFRTKAWLLVSILTGTAMCDSSNNVGELEMTCKVCVVLTAVNLTISFIITSMPQHQYPQIVGLKLFYGNGFRAVI